MSVRRRYMTSTLSTDKSNMKQFLSYLNNKFFLYLVVTFASILAYLNRFIQDDAFISFIYARNWVDGNGLTWFGTKVEGYTNFLWVILMGLGLKSGFDLIIFSWLMSFIFFILTIFVIYKIASNLFHSQLISFLSVFLFITNFSVSSYATSGLETMMQTSIIACVALLSLKIKSECFSNPATIFFLSILATAAIFVRMDSAIIIALIFAFLIYESIRIRRKTNV